MQKIEFYDIFHYLMDKKMALRAKMATNNSVQTKRITYLQINARKTKHIVI